MIPCGFLQDVGAQIVLYHIPEDQGKEATTNAKREEDVEEEENKPADVALLKSSEGIIAAGGDHDLSWLSTIVDELKSMVANVADGTSGGLLAEEQQVRPEL